MLRLRRWLRQAEADAAAAAAAEAEQTAKTLADVPVEQQHLIQVLQQLHEHLKQAGCQGCM